LAQKDIRRPSSNGRYWVKADIHKHALMSPYDSKQIWVRGICCDAQQNRASRFERSSTREEGDEATRVCYGTWCCNVGFAAHVEYAHAGADPRLLKELSRDWLDEAALYSQALKLLI
jgi:hypothetical protein